MFCMWVLAQLNHTRTAYKSSGYRIWIFLDFVQISQNIVRVIVSMSPELENIVLSSAYRATSAILVGKK